MQAIEKILGTIGLLVMIIGGLRIHDALGERKEETILGILLLNVVPGAGLVFLARVLRKKHSKPEPVDHIEKSSGSSRKDWIRKVMDVIEKEGHLHYPQNKVVINMIGLAPVQGMHSVLSGAGSAEGFVKTNENSRQYEGICFRALVLFFSRSGQFEFAKHSGILNGIVGGFFWPPHSDWPDTPVIYSNGITLSKACRPDEAKC